MTQVTQMTQVRNDPLYTRAQKLGLYGLVKDWHGVCQEPWLEPLLAKEEAERKQRGLERCIKTSKIGRFKAMADFDYTWPKKIDRQQVDDLFSFTWIDEITNVILVGPNGVGKTMIAQNLAYQAVLRGTTARFLTASQMLNDLAAQVCG